MWQSILRGYLWSAVKSVAMAAPGGKSGSSASGAGKRCDVGLVFALSQEASCFVDRIERVSTIRGHGFVARSGLLNARSIVAIESGAGRDAAAKATDALIVAHRPKLVISAGFAGGLAKGIEKRHFVIADSVRQEHGSRLTIDLAIDRTPQPAIHVGPMVTVDRIVGTSREKRQLYEHTGAIAVDMESAAVAEVCRNYATPFMSIRIVSDGANDELPREISRLITKPSRVRQVGFALGAMLRRPSVARDLYQLQQSATDLSERLAKFLVEMLDQLPPGQTR
jgi:adenosylhomocysteine nucleosidase